MEPLCFCHCHMDYKEAGQSHRWVAQLRWAAQFSTTPEQINQQACRAPRRKDALPQSHWERKGYNCCIAGPCSWVTNTHEHEYPQLRLTFISPTPHWVNLIWQCNLLKPCLFEWIDTQLFSSQSFFSSSVQCTAMLKKRRNKVQNGS